MNDNQLEAIVNWVAGGPQKIKINNCFILNFGFPNDITLPQLLINDNKFFNNMTNIEKIQSNIPSRCFVVFVGGKYVTRLNQIYLKVQKLQSALFIKSPLLFIAEKNKNKISSLEKPKREVKLRNAIENKYNLLFYAHLDLNLSFISISLATYFLASDTDSKIYEFW